VILCTIIQLSSATGSYSDICIAQR